jgi:hypothetical protein
MTRPIRVVFDNRPYLVTLDADGALDRAYGPFAPGTEPSLTDCNASTEVHSSATRNALELLLPISPEVTADTLARG